MPTKREMMRKKARKELSKKGIQEKEETSEEEDTPSLIGGFTFIFLGTLSFFMLSEYFNYIIGIFTGLPFILLGMYRFGKASASRAKNSVTKN